MFQQQFIFISDLCISSLPIIYTAIASKRYGSSHILHITETYAHGIQTSTGKDARMEKVDRKIYIQFFLKMDFIFIDISTSDSEVFAL